MTLPTRSHRSKNDLLEVGIMFLPAIPAYLWVWPNVEGMGFWIFQSLSYAYVLAGTLYIGLRRWSLCELGLNRNGLRLSLVYGLLIVAGCTLIILAWGIDSQPFGISRLLGEAPFYCVNFIVETEV